MRSLNYIKNQIEFAAKGSGKIPVNQNLIEAFNDVAEFVNKGEFNSDVEDSLMLFYLLQIWKVDNEKNKLLLSKSRKEISDPYLTLESLFMSVKPKENIIDEIFTELKVYQLINKIPKEEIIKKKEVRKLLDELLKEAKKMKKFSLLKAKIHNYG